jgi:ATP-dependent Clp protease ATP-binding subunit ClpC
MFERFTEQARRTLFFARYEASQLGVPSIETEHLLLGLIREGKGLTSRIFAESHLSLESIRREIEVQTVFMEKVPTSVEIPFSAETKNVMQFAAEEANRLRHTYVEPEHLLLGILHEERSVAGRLLIDKGMRLGAVREQIVQLKKSMGVENESLEADVQEITMTARHRIFQSRSKSWEDLCEEATAFATQLGPDKVISISVAASGGTDLFGHGWSGLIVVWYWE